MLTLACIIAILLLAFVHLQRWAHAENRPKTRLGPTFKGMTTRERLLAAGLVDDFSTAIRDNDVGAISEILQLVELPYAESRAIAETIIGAPDEYGF